MKRLLLLIPALVTVGCSPPNPPPSQLPVASFETSARGNGLVTIVQIKKAIAQQAKAKGGKNPSAQVIFQVTFDVLESTGTINEVKAMKDYATQQATESQKAVAALAPNVSANTKTRARLLATSDASLVTAVDIHLARYGLSAAPKISYSETKRTALETSQKRDAIKDTTATD